MHRDSKARKKYNGLLTKLNGKALISNLAIKHDTLLELKDLSESLQKQDIKLVNAHQLINRTVRIFRAMKEKDKEFLNEICNIKNDKFHGVVWLEPSNNCATIKKEQFYESLAANIASSCESNSEKETVQNFKILEPNSWPVEDDLLYGENDIRHMCRMFCLP